MASKAQDILPPRLQERAVSYSLSVSPATTFHSPTHRSAARPKHLKPFNSMDVKILLLENVNQTGRDIRQGEGYQVEALKTSLPEDQLIEKIRCVLVRKLKRGRWSWGGRGQRSKKR